VYIQFLNMKRLIGETVQVSNLSHEMQAEWTVWSVSMPIKVSWLLF